MAKTSKRKTYTPEEIAELEAARAQATREAHEACAKARPIKAPDGRTWTPDVITPASWPDAVVPNAGVMAWTCGGLAVHPTIGSARKYQVSLAGTGHRVHAHNAGAGEPREACVIRAGMMLEAFDGWETLDPDDNARVQAAGKATEKAREAKIDLPKREARPVTPRAVKAGGVTWTPGTYLAAYAGARHEREAHLAGGLAVHRVRNRDGVTGKGYQVSQVVSGHILSSAIFPTRAEAFACAAKVLAAVDWTRDFMAENDVEAHRAALDAIRSAFPDT